MTEFTERDRDLFPFVRAYARKRYAVPSNDDIEITDIISKSADDGYWVTARVHVRASEARQFREDIK